MGHKLGVVKRSRGMSLGSVLPLFISTPSTTAKSLQWGNRNWASQRLRIVAKSKSDASPSSSTPTSLLSFLCPLLTLFSVCILIHFFYAFLYQLWLTVHNVFFIYWFWQGKDPSQPRNLPFEVISQRSWVAVIALKSLSIFFMHVISST